MVALLSDNSYLALFLISFLALTILPAGSEWLLVTLILRGSDPILSVIIATTGNRCSHTPIPIRTAPVSKLGVTPSPRYS